MSLKKIIALSALLFFVLIMAVITVPYLSLRTDIGFLLTKQTVLHKKAWYFSFYTHITTSLIVLFTGGLQLCLPRLKAETHRILGIIYVVLILFFAAPSGFIMAIYANGGLPAKVSFVFISLAWWYFTWKAFEDAKKKNWNSHRAFMIRSYALTLSAITLRLYVMILPFVIHLSAKQAYILVSYLSWIPNLMIAEFVIRRTSMFYSILRRFPQAQISR